MSPDVLQTIFITAIIGSMVTAFAGVVMYAFRTIITIPKLYATKSDVDKRYIDIQLERGEDIEKAKEQYEDLARRMDAMAGKLDEMHEIIRHCGAMDVRIEHLEECVGSTSSGLVLGLHQLKNDMAHFVPGYAEIRNKR